MKTNIGHMYSSDGHRVEFILTRDGGYVWDVMTQCELAAYCTERGLREAYQRADALPTDRYGVPRYAMMCALHPGEEDQD